MCARLGVSTVQQRNTKTPTQQKLLVDLKAVRAKFEVFVSLMLMFLSQFFFCKLLQRFNTAPLGSNKVSLFSCSCRAFITVMQNITCISPREIPSNPYILSLTLTIWDVCVMYLQNSVQSALAYMHFKHSHALYRKGMYSMLNVFNVQQVDLQLGKSFFYSTIHVQTCAIGLFSVIQFQHLRLAKAYDLSI